MITCWSGRSDDLSPPPPPPPPRTRNSTLSQEWKRRKVEKGVSRSAVGFAGVGGEVGEKGLVCNYGPSPRAAIQYTYNI